MHINLLIRFYLIRNNSILDKELDNQIYQHKQCKQGYYFNKVYNNLTNIINFLNSQYGYDEFGKNHLKGQNKQTKCK